MEYYAKELAQRNFETVNMVLKDHQKGMNDLREENEKLKQQIASQNNMIAQIQQRLNIVFAKAMGGGATA